MTKKKNSRTSRIDQVRKILRDNLDGLSIHEILAMSGVKSYNLYRILRKMPDAYIDRWSRNDTNHQTSAIWCVVVPPEDCPRPSPVKKTSKKQTKE